MNLHSRAENGRQYWLVCEIKSSDICNGLDKARGNDFSYQNHATIAVQYTHTTPKTLHHFAGLLKIYSYANWYSITLGYNEINMK